MTCRLTDPGQLPAPAFPCPEQAVPAHPRLRAHPAWQCCQQWGKQAALHPGAIGPGCAAQLCIGDMHSSTRAGEGDQRGHAQAAALPGSLTGQGLGMPLPLRSYNSYSLPRTPASPAQPGTCPHPPACGTIPAAACHRHLPLAFQLHFCATSGACQPQPAAAQDTQTK